MVLPTYTESQIEYGFTEVGQRSEWFWIWKRWLLLYLCLLVNIILTCLSLSVWLM